MLWRPVISPAAGFRRRHTRCRVRLRRKTVATTGAGRVIMHSHMRTRGATCVRHTAHAVGVPTYIVPRADVGVSEICEDKHHRWEQVRHLVGGTASSQGVITIHTRESRQNEESQLSLLDAVGTHSVN